MRKSKMRAVESDSAVLLFVPIKEITVVFAVFVVRSIGVAVPDVEEVCPEEWLTSFGLAMFL
ncbi:hypothetical protein [Arthrobacter polaris]|uniref:hypothetical protein n=1 Tax=Arthrobacter polaris TaxID=2813727 RepID=UPI001F233B44|nr:hypothetical protein [Arthrobacter polaris]UIK89385.1 hypothetical protein J0916_02685 [Arthrobacter polaris]